ncbi:XRE family transcriptional regulator [Agromyces tardus]|uniref:XRE family transcriptional regulator n=1 Tax=Agromyces tardus TaxID=2583849 RepID=A0A3M8A914_9MICO|nr:helix-turn-helix transcriptional regulator [Agromyces tardus]RNB47602.1 XRE family transcriptional regulator [Agromyces tardus]
MKREIEYQWRVRELMARQRIKSSADLVEPLRERGITLSPSQIYRLVAQDPERIAFKVLVALCDILHCEVNDLVTFTATDARTMRRKTAANGGPDIPDLRNYRPVRARVIDEDDG